MFYLYMIKNQENKLYVGISENPEQRVIYHNTKQGAQFTKSRDKFHLTFKEGYTTLAEARKREIQIKKWRRDKKEKLVNLYKKNINTKL